MFHSSPLGELFDHGLDSTAAWMMAVSLLSCFGTQYHSHYEVFLLIVVITAGFFLAHWEKYNTSVLYLPWAYDFSQVVSKFLSMSLFHQALILDSSVSDTGIMSHYHTNTYKVTTMSTHVFNRILNETQNLRKTPHKR